MTPFHVGDVPVHLHPTFLWLVVAYVVWTVVNQGLVAGALAVALVVAFFGSVLFHELGHAWAARWYGIRTRSIVLLPIGGAAQLEMRRGGVRPWVDLVISVAGPAASMVLGVALIAAWAVIPWEPLLSLGSVNVALGVFNLLPAFPMDGGRVLRAALTGWLGLVSATRLTLGVGALLAAMFMGLGLLEGELGLMLLAVFLWLVQWREWQTNELARALSAQG